MKIDIGIKSNCSEWDTEVESDYISDDRTSFMASLEILTKRCVEEDIKKGWDK